MGIYVSFQLCDLYGIALAALGMLSTLATGLTIDGFGPIADNAGGIAEMAQLEKKVRETTDALDAAGNTTAAIGKGFAIGSAALVSLALYGAFVIRLGITTGVNVLQPITFAFLLIGSMIPYWFAALTMKSVGKAANEMVIEVERQFNTIKDDQGRPLLDENCTAKPDYDRCISISNSGGAWDNCKKYISGGFSDDAALKGKKVPAHDAAVTGDTVGDPFKDTSGPALNIVMKLQAIVSLVFAQYFAAINDGQGFFMTSMKAM